MFNYTAWTTKQFWVFTIFVFIGGMFFSIRTVEKRIEIPVEKRVEVVKEVPAQCDYSEWKRLKSTDDWGFSYCTIALNLASRGVTALGNMDIEEVNNITLKMKENNVKISETAQERQTILEKLGY